MMREIVRDWIAAELARSEAVALTGASEAGFTLAAYVETHEAIGEARAAVERAPAPDGNATVAKRDALGGAMGGAGELG